MNRQFKNGCVIVPLALLSAVVVQFASSGYSFRGLLDDSATLFRLFTGWGSGYVQVDDKWVFVYEHFALGRHETPLGDVDTSSFEVLTKSSYARDSQRVWWHGVRIYDADSNTFELLPLPYSRDETRVYCGTVPISGADPGAFEALLPFPEDWDNDGSTPTTVDSVADYYGVALAMESDFEVKFEEYCWAKDQHACYYGPIIVEGADPETFEVINRYYARDNKSVFAAECRIDGADPKTFQCDDSHELQLYGQDARRHYDAGTIINDGRSARAKALGMLREDED